MEIWVILPLLAFLGGGWTEGLKVMASGLKSWKTLSGLDLRAGGRASSPWLGQPASRWVASVVAVG